MHPQVSSPNSTVYDVSVAKGEQSDCSVRKNASNLPEDLLFFAFPFLQAILCWCILGNGCVYTQPNPAPCTQALLFGRPRTLMLRRESRLLSLVIRCKHLSWHWTLSALHTTIGLVHDQISQFTHTLGNVAQHPLSSPNSAVLCAANSSTLHDGAATVHRRSSFLMHPLSV